ncbi:MAG: exodeoxyribonuclease III [Bacillota bacterium]|nr:MAG: exodeoxyribonuclease III [Bacillota bacterium]MBS3949416.1 exodeoxyribonuclease III [Peptococcaceae bacterium]
MTKLISWNVNGIRACVNKGFLDFFNQADADIFSIQESKISAGQIELLMEGYDQYYSYAEKKGYSGTAVFTKVKPINVSYGLNIPAHDQEGRLITLEYEDYYLVNSYSPNSQRGLARLDYRMEWDDCFRDYLRSLDAHKPVVFCGDFNVAHKDIDIKNPKTNRRNAGFTDEERAKFTMLLESGFIDSYRHFYPDREGAYTWWSYFANARERNIGWRIDYFCTSERLKDRLLQADIHPHIMGSDHCPVELIMGSGLTF